MSWMKKLQALAARLGEKAADATTPAKALDWEASIVEEDDGKKWFAYIKIGEYSARERLPLDIHKWSNERQSDYLDKVNSRLTKKLSLEMKDVNPIANASRRQRRAYDKITRTKARRIKVS